MIQDSQHSLIKCKSCLTSLVDCYNRVAETVIISVGNGRAMDVVYLDFCKVFDMVLHNIPLSKWERYGFNGWERNWLDSHIQRAVNETWWMLSWQVMNPTRLFWPILFLFLLQGPGVELRSRQNKQWKVGSIKSALKGSSLALQCQASLATLDMCPLGQTRLILMRHDTLNSLVKTPHTCTYCPV